MKLMNGLFSKAKQVVCGVADKGLALFALCLAVFAMAGQTMAGETPLVDWAATASSVKTEASPAITAAIGVGVAFLAIAIGYKMLRRFAK